MPADPQRLTLTASAVLLDMDGTLVDSAAVVDAVWGRFSRELGLDARVVLRFAHGRRPTDTLRRFLPEASDAVRDDLARRFVAEEVSMTEGVVEIPGARAFLERLRDSGVPHALVTSATVPLASARMEAAGLAMPDIAVTAEDVSEGKPHPEGYLSAAQALGVEPSASVVFEDAEAGIVAGMSSGARVIVVGAHRFASTASLSRIPHYGAVSVHGGPAGALLALG